MALVVFVRDIKRWPDTGGFRSSILAKKRRDFDGINIGAAGTFLVRKPGPRTKFRREWLRKLPLFLPLRPEKK